MLDARDPLDVLGELKRDRERLDDEVVAQVRRARVLGRSWKDIADVLGVSRQAAWEQFHELAPDRAEVIADVLGSLKGPGGASEEIRKDEREAESAAEKRRLA